MTKLAELQDGVVDVSNAADRAAHFPAPNTGQKVYRIDTGIIERYTGSAWVNALNDLPAFPVVRYGGKFDGLTLDDQAWADAIGAATASADGGRVIAPAGSSLISSSNSIAIDGVAAGRSVIVEGALGLRGTKIYPTTSGQTALRMGPVTPDASGTSTHNIAYCGFRRLNVVGSLLPSAIAIGLKATQAQKCLFEDVLVEAMPSTSLGVDLIGSTTSGGAGAAASPHVWRCSFNRVIATTTKRPWLLTNVDESTFIDCDAGALLGQGTATYAWEIRQGHSNRWLSALAAGDTDLTYRTNYRGFAFFDPVNGDNLGHFLSGAVGEGHKHMIWIENSAVSDILGENLSASICEFDFYNGADNGGNERQNRVVLSFLGNNHRRYMSTRSFASEPLTFTTADTTPSVKGSDYFACNSQGPMTFLDDGTVGREVTIVMDAGSSFVNSATFKCPGAADITGAAHKVVKVVKFVPTVWETISVSLNA